MTKYYFVKYNGRWTVAAMWTYDDGENYSEGWLTIGEERIYSKYSFDEIGDEILLPGEE